MGPFEASSAPPRVLDTKLHDQHVPVGRPSCQPSNDQGQLMHGVMVQLCAIIALTPILRYDDMFISLALATGGFGTLTDDRWDSSEIDPSC